MIHTVRTYQSLQKAYSLSDKLQKQLDHARAIVKELGDEASVEKAVAVADKYSIERNYLAVQLQLALLEESLWEETFEKNGRKKYILIRHTDLKDAFNDHARNVRCPRIDQLEIQLRRRSPPQKRIRAPFRSRISHGPADKCEGFRAKDKD